MGRTLASAQLWSSLWAMELMAVLAVLHASVAVGKMDSSAAFGAATQTRTAAEFVRAARGICGSVPIEQALLLGGVEPQSAAGATLLMATHQNCRPASF